MRIYLNAGFGDLIGAEDMRLITSLGFFGVRQDVRSLDTTKEVVQEFAGSGLTPLFVVHYGSDTAEIAQEIARVASQELPDYAIEVGNELDLKKVDPKGYGLAFSEMDQACQKIDPYVKMVTAGIGTTNKSGLAWLESALLWISSSAIVGFHSYRPNMNPSPFASQSGFRTRQGEFLDLQRFAGKRRLWNTEIGWHTAPRVSGWWIFKKRIQLTDEQVFQYLKEEVLLSKAAGVEVLTIYQLNDGDNPNYDQDRYGIRTLGGRLKPQSAIARGAWV